MVENQSGHKIHTICTDRWVSTYQNPSYDFLASCGIKHQFTVPYSPQQNGVAEWQNRSLMEEARCMLKSKTLPNKFWMDTVQCATYGLNKQEP